MAIEKMIKLPYLKRQPRGYISSSFCDGKYRLTKESIDANLFFEKDKVAENKKESNRIHEIKKK